jgi:hypothetical protein
MDDHRLAITYAGLKMIETIYKMLNLSKVTW